MDERNTGCSKHNHGRHDNCSCGGHSHENHEHDGNCGCGAHSHENHEHDGNCGCGAHSHEDHEHDGDCSCGAYSHENHEHDDNCGCGAHSHDGHEHDDNCGCGGHSHEGHAPDYENGLSIGENNVLMALLERGALPVARFALTSSKEPEAYAVALEPVYIADPGDSLDAIKEYGVLFEGLEDKGLIGMDYKRPLPGYPYREYRESAAFRHFAETAAEAKERGFTYDTPNLELGVITLTECGQETVDRMIR